MEHPNKLIDSFSGTIDIKEFGRLPITTSNLLLRGCVLRNTDWVIGLVVNTGHDTKVMMSNTETKPKTSFLESVASVQILRIIALLSLVCFWGATGQAIWDTQNNIWGIWYLQWTDNAVSNWFIKFFYFFLLHATFIPVSLYVSMAMVRSFQAYFMNCDLEMYYSPTDRPASVRTMNLNEELGQISHIFSDKTGTLTCNVMDFRKMSVNGVAYGRGITEIGRASWKLQGKEVPADVIEGEEQAKKRSVPHVSFYCPVYERDMSQHGSEQRRLLQEFFKILAICHDVIPERIDGQVKLSASNPDDEALVCAASYFGFEFRDRIGSLSIVHNNDAGRDENIEVLATIAFTSKRKKMSVVYREASGIIRIATKGADTAMMEILAAGQDRTVQKTEADMVQYSTEGLRCLLVGYRVIPEQEFQSWFSKYSACKADIQEIEKRKNGHANMIDKLESEIESKLTLLGATAIEDRLQEGVPKAIADLSAAGINIWVLTGDKQETAINIAVACNLVLPKNYMKQIIINASKTPTRDQIRGLLSLELKV
jgi:phospholipid-translocating P-type ATPase (flippase)